MVRHLINSKVQKILPEKQNVPQLLKDFTPISWKPNFHNRLHVS